MPSSLGQEIFNSVQIFLLSYLFIYSEDVLQSENFEGKITLFH